MRLPRMRTLGMNWPPKSDCHWRWVQVWTHCLPPSRGALQPAASRAMRVRATRAFHTTLPEKKNNSPHHHRPHRHATCIPLPSGTFHDDKLFACNQGDDADYDHDYETRDQRSETRDQRPETRDQRPETRDKRLETRDQRPETRDQSPETRD